MNVLADRFADPVAAHAEATIAHLGEDPSRPGLLDTPRRFAKAMRFLTGGYSLEPADVVVLHRVVCCYPDYERLMSAAAGHAKRLLVFSYPTRNVFTRMIVRFENLLHRLRRSDFRAFVHPPVAMIKTAQATGLSLTYTHHGPAWNIAGLERATPDLSAP